MIDEKKDLDRPFSEHEKASIREELRVFMRNNPARAPFLIRALDSLEMAVFKPQLQFAAATLALVLVAGSGTAFAAQNALPGEPLYGVKVNIEEPIAGAFATSPEAQANWNAQLAATRLSEAEQLAAQNRLTPADATAIASGLNQATESFDANVAQLATSSTNAATVATLASNMEATLAANTQVMSEIETAVPSVAKTLAPIISNTQERTVALNSTRKQFDDTAAQTDVAQVKVAAEAQLDAAEDQVNGIALNPQSTPTATSSTVAAQTQEAEADIQSGQQNLAQGNYVAALETLQTATVEAHTAQLNVTIGQQLGSAGGELASSTTSSTLAAIIGQNVATSSSATSTATMHHDHNDATTTDESQ